VPEFGACAFLVGQRLLSDAEINILSLKFTGGIGRVGNVVAYH
jgi:hypothetical protein